MGLFRRAVHHPVTHNALGIYGMMFASYVLPLVTLPYLARVLQPREFGLLVFAQSFASWSSLTLEYGFNLSATREIAQNREKEDLLSQVAAAVLGAKAMLLWVLLLVTAVVGVSVSNFREHPYYLLWAAVQTLGLGFSPFWYFQGTEKMLRAIVPDFFVRTVATVLVFFAVHRSSDGWKAMALQALASVGATTIATIWMYHEVRFSWPRLSSSITALKKGWNMFFFRGAYNVYSSANTFILGLFASPLQVGYFGGAQRIARALQGMNGPLAQALYPRMSHIVSQDTKRGARLARLTLFLNCAIGVALSVGLVILARWVVAVGLGRGYEASVEVLYIFSLFLPINAANTALIMHWMVPLGMEQVVARITLGAIGLNLALAALLAPRYGHLGMAWVMVAAESSKLLTIAAVLIRRKLMPLNMLEPEPQSVEMM